MTEKEKYFRTIERMEPDIHFSTADAFRASAAASAAISLKRIADSLDRSSEPCLDRSSEPCLKSDVVAVMRNVQPSLLDDLLCYRLLEAILDAGFKIHR